MGSVINMNNNEVELDAMEDDYGDEIMCGGWNPDVDLVCQQLKIVSTNEQMAMSANPAALISDLMQRRMYSYPY